MENTEEFFLEHMEKSRNDQLLTDRYLSGTTGQIVDYEHILLYIGMMENMTTTMTFET